MLLKKNIRQTAAYRISVGLVRKARVSSPVQPSKPVKREMTVSIAMGGANSFKHISCWKERLGFVSNGAAAGVFSLRPLRENSCMFFISKPDYMQGNTCLLSSISPHNGTSLAVPQTLTNHSWGKGHHHIGGALIITQKLRFWEWIHKHIPGLPVHLKIKYVYLTEHCDGICCFPWPEETHRLLAGVVLAENMRMKTTLLNPFV